MKLTNKLTALGVMAAVATTAFAPLAAQADGSLQGNKNLMRNLSIGAAALGGYGLLNHDNGLALLGVAGAAVAGSQYEKDRHQQSENQSRRDWYYRNDQDYEHRGNQNDSTWYHHSGRH